ADRGGVLAQLEARHRDAAQGPRVRLDRVRAPEERARLGPAARLELLEGLLDPRAVVLGAVLLRPRRRREREEEEHERQRAQPRPDAVRAATADPTARRRADSRPRSARRGQKSSIE